MTKSLKREIHRGLGKYDNRLRSIEKLLTNSMIQKQKIKKAKKRVNNFVEISIGQKRP